MHAFTGSRRISYLLLVISLSFSMVNLLTMMWQNSWVIPPVHNSTSLEMQSNRKPKTILLWNAPHRPETLLFGSGRQVFRQHGCPVSDCELVLSRELTPFKNISITSYDAILFNMIDDFFFSPLPKAKQRKAYQRYIFFTLESPARLKNFDEIIYRIKFNWTMTYRQNSDISLRYGRIKSKTSAPKTSDEVTALIEATRYGRSYVGSKTKIVAWMASKCVTFGQREYYVSQLAKHIEVDIYGDCGQLQCDKDELISSHPKCYDMLESNYKFYLSFENSFCEDYVTEKFFSIMHRNIVPIVFGQANYSRIAPPHSYIDANHFEPEQLATYLKMLDANDTLYNEYFWWKEHYTVESGLLQMIRHGFCDLCQKLHQDHRRKTYRRGTLFSQWDINKVCYAEERKSLLWTS